MNKVCIEKRTDQYLFQQVAFQCLKILFAKIPTEILSILSRLITSSGRAPTRLSMAYIVITQTFIPRGVHRCWLSAVPNSSVYSVYKPDQGLPSPSQHDEWLLRTHSNDAGRRRDPSPAPPWCVSGFIADTTYETQAMKTHHRSLESTQPQGRCQCHKSALGRCNFDIQRSIRMRARHLPTRKLLKLIKS